MGAVYVDRDGEWMQRSLGVGEEDCSVWLMTVESVCMRRWLDFGGRRVGTDFCVIKRGLPL